MVVKLKQYQAPVNSKSKNSQTQVVKSTLSREITPGLPRTEHELKTSEGTDHHLKRNN